MDNRHLVTRKLGGVPGKNHHGDLISTPPKKSAAQKFRPAGPIRAADTNYWVLRTLPITKHVAITEITFNH